jgi:hypothetical protein
VNGFTPFYGSNYDLLTSAEPKPAIATRHSTRSFHGTDSPTQPLFRNFRFDLNRHNIEIAKKNPSLSDAVQAEGHRYHRAVEQAYWNLVFSPATCRQIDAVKDAKHSKGSFRQVDKAFRSDRRVAATAQIAT